METDAETLARGLLAAWNARDMARFMALLDDSIIWYDPAMPSPPARGKEEVRRFADAVLAAFPDFAYAIREPLCVSADRRRCVFPWRITATHSGWLIPPGLAPTMQQVSIEGVDVLDCRDGKVTAIETYFDPLPAAEQLLRLRLRPRPGSFRERFVVLAQRTRAAWLRKSGA